MLENCPREKLPMIEKLPRMIDNAGGVDVDVRGCVEGGGVAWGGRVEGVSARVEGVVGGGRVEGGGVAGGRVEGVGGGVEGVVGGGRVEGGGGVGVGGCVAVGVEGVGVGVEGGGVGASKASASVSKMAVSKVSVLAPKVSKVSPSAPKWTWRRRADTDPDGDTDVGRCRWRHGGHICTMCSVDACMGP